MMVDFESVFSPTEEERKKRKRFYHRLHRKAIMSKDCTYCKHAKLETRYEMGYESGIYAVCKLTGKCSVNSCNRWERRMKGEKT